jgi:hypothetical protein
MDLVAPRANGGIWKVINDLRISDEVWKTLSGLYPVTRGLVAIEI